MDQSSLRRSLPAGILDAGFASLATFAAGLYATRELEPSDLGVYAVFFSAFLTATVVPRQLVGSPAMVQAVRIDRDLRLGLLPRALRLAVLPALLSTSIIAAAAAITWRQADTAVMVGLFASTAVATVLSPLQDMVRRFFHVARKSWRSSMISVVQFVATASVVVAAMLWDWPDAWVPFGALTAANAFSITAGLVAWKRLAPRGEPAVHLRFGRLASSGRWLLVKAVLPTAAGFASAAIIGILASPSALGFAEAARIAAQPVLVLAIGLSATVGPPSMEAAARRDLPGANRPFRVNAGVLGLASILYLLVAGGDWPWNPMAKLVPNAYEVNWLVAVTLLAHLVTGLFYPRDSEFMGGRKEKPLLAIEAVASPVRVLVALTAGVTDAFARPLGHFAMSATRLAVSVKPRRGIYEEASHQRAGARSRAGD